jgi:hypothetical protein
MPYSSRRRHNSPSISQTSYQTLIIHCPNFDPIYQVILLENSNEWNLSLAKEGSSKRERERGEKEKKGKEQGLKRKGGKTSFEKLHVSKREKKERMKLLGEILSKRKERRSHFPIVQNPMCGLIHTHTSFAFPLPSIP